MNETADHASVNASSGLLGAEGPGRSGIVGLIGLGQMGLPISQRLATLGDVHAYDLSAERRNLAAEHPRVSPTTGLGTLAECSRIVLSLPHPAASKAVVRELVPLLRPGTILIETSTVLPSDVRELSEIVAPAGGRVIDAAILSGVGQMTAGHATLLVGGAAPDIDAVLDVISALGPAGIRRFGALGSGMAAKVVNNGVAHAVMVVLAEGFSLARAQGLPLSEIADMLAQPDGGLIRPLTHRVRERVATGDYVGGMPLDAARKDSTLALSLAQASGVPLFATQGAHTVYELGAAAGLARDDYAAIATLWEGWIGASLTFDVEPADDPSPAGRPPGTEHTLIADPGNQR